MVLRLNNKLLGSPGPDKKHFRPRAIYNLYVRPQVQEGESLAVDAGPARPSP